MVEADSTVNTYFLWALNALLQELLDPLAQSNGAPANTLFQSLLAPPATAQFPNTSSSPATLPTPDVGTSVNVQTAIQSAAAATGLSPALLKAVASVESGLDPSAISSAGAVGLMQLMPSTAASLEVNPNNIAQNALGGAEYLQSLLNQFGHNLSLALAAYNAGPGAVDQYGGIPPYAQTQQYVKAVLAAYQANSGTATPANSSWTE